MIEGLMNELICLCEIRGELDPESNAKIETKIAELNKQIKELEAAE
jgi:ABC-type phosphate transport system ATPase subunit